MPATAWRTSVAARHLRAGLQPCSHLKTSSCATPSQHPCRMRVGLSLLHGSKHQAPRRTNHGFVYISRLPSPAWQIPNLTGSMLELVSLPGTQDARTLGRSPGRVALQADRSDCSQSATRRRHLYIKVRLATTTRGASTPIAVALLQARAQPRQKVLPGASRHSPQ